MNTPNKKFTLNQVLNLTVRERLVQDLELMLIFSQKHPGLDPDIDPTHNSDWRISRQKEEQQLLELCVEAVSLMREEYTKAHNEKTYMANYTCHVL